MPGIGYSTWLRPNAVRIYWEFSYGAPPSHCWHGKPLVEAAMARCLLGALRRKGTLATKPERHEEFKYCGEMLLPLTALASLKGEPQAQTSEPPGTPCGCAHMISPSCLTYRRGAVQSRHSVVNCKAS